jgi:hypothetical protein
MRSWQRIAGIVRLGCAGRNDPRCGRRYAIGRHKWIRKRSLLTVAAGETDRNQSDCRQSATLIRMKSFHPQHPFLGAMFHAAQPQRLKSIAATGSGRAYHARPTTYRRSVAGAQA